MKKRIALILSHGRPNSCVTISTLRRSGYTGEIGVLIDDEDGTKEEYKKNYPDVRFFSFCKSEEMSRKFSCVDNFGIRGTVLYARNAAWKIMKDFGYDQFVMLDDDYTEFEYKWLEGNILKRKDAKNLDAAFSAYFEYLEEGGLDVVCAAQGGDFIGGGSSGTVQKWVSRKAMNVYFFNTNNPYYFTGAMNDDVNTYVIANIRGRKILTIPCLSIVQKTTQKNEGGLTKMYLDFGTYNKSFYTCIVAPSCCKIGVLGDASRGHAYWRIHHSITWNNCAPKIIDEKWRK